MNQIFAFSTSLRVLQIIGINSITFDRWFRPHDTFRTRIYIFFNLIFCIASLAFLIYEKELYLTSQSNDIGRFEKLVNFMQLSALKISHFVIICEVFLYRKLMVKYFDGIIEVDLMIKKIGFEIDFKEKRRKNLIILLMFSAFIFGCRIGISILDGEIFKSFINFVTTILLLIPFIITNFRNFEVFNLIWIIRGRLEILNLKLEEIQLNQNDYMQIIPSKEIINLSFTFNLSQMNKKKSIMNFDKLILIRQMYNKVYKLSVLVNNSFGKSNLINIARDFVFVTSQIYFTFIHIVTSDKIDKIRITISLLAFLPHAMNIFIYSILCHMTTQTVSIHITNKMKIY